MMKTIVGLGSCAWLARLAAANVAAADDPIFRDKVAPILERRCLHCHGEATQKGNLSLSTAAAVFKGGDSGPAVVPGKPEESILLDMIGGDPPEMPQKERAALEAGSRAHPQLDRGRRGLAGRAGRSRTGGSRVSNGGPSSRSIVPKSQRSSRIPTGHARRSTRSYWPRSSSRGLTPSPEADRRTLIRRLSFDLIGLPPTPEEIDAFVADPNPNAYEALVDRLLASPHYGERWGRHWLDVVHYGDTHGYDKDKRRDNAWPYRDYVIAAFNADLPFGRFIREQVAGDVLWPDDGRGAIATGVHRRRARGTSWATSSCAKGPSTS